jgi:hypothetical protein
VSRKENRVYKQDGKLVIEFTFRKDSTMLEMENEIESLIDSIDESLSELEKQSIKTQLLDARKNSSKKMSQ